jgi:hypothetical protein
VQRRSGTVGSRAATRYRSEGTCRKKVKHEIGLKISEIEAGQGETVIRDRLFEKRRRGAPPGSSRTARRERLCTSVTQVTYNVPLCVLKPKSIRT